MIGGTRWSFFFANLATGSISSLHHRNGTADGTLCVQSSWVSASIRVMVVA